MALSAPVRSRIEFPLLDRDVFDRHPKSRKAQDRERMLFSEASEDWVTWTVSRLLQRYAPVTWWADLVKLAMEDNPGMVLPVGWDETPAIRLWDSVPSPSEYEVASRERMRRSNNPVWVARSHDPKPVEGASEIDVMFRNRAIIVFAEAKLGSDISTSTTYDPHRNQIVRNIDCALDQAEGRVAIFWMLVRDTGQGRLYTQLMNHYRADPDVLVRELPHRDPDTVTALARNLSLILWSAVVRPVLALLPADGTEITAIRNELRRRL